MPVQFLGSFGSKLAEQWIPATLSPAFVFWAGGIAAFLQRFGWSTANTCFKQQPEPLTIALLLGGLCLITVSAFVVRRFDLPVLKFLSGYWHPWLRPLRRRFIGRVVKRSQKNDDRWQTLAQIDPVQLTSEQRDEFVQIDWQQHHLPLPQSLMPTHLGNILRAAEQRPGEKYGLDAIICWSRLWLLLPEPAQKNLLEARADLNAAARIWIWSMLFIVWTFWAWWAAPLGIISAFFAYSWTLEAAIAYGELIEAVFDLYRHRLYQSLRWRLPADPDEERRVGRQLTEYLWRGF